MTTEPHQHHQQLQRLVGEWLYEGECELEPGQPPAKFNGTENVRPLGGFWILCEGQGEMPDGSPATTLMTLGFNPATGRFAGTWIGSMMTHLWLYDGWLDQEEKVLTLNSVGPSDCEAGPLTNYQDVIELVSDDHRILTSRRQSPDGAWHSFMTAHYRRK